VLRRFRLAGSLLLLPGALTAQPILTFEANAVVASGVTAGGRVAILGVGRDGHEADQDGAATGGVALLLPGLEPVGTTRAAPEGLVPGDVLIALDPNRLEASPTRLAVE
jgi:hypothetical protein